jgi:hypothetical protein
MADFDPKITSLTPGESAMQVEATDVGQLPSSTKSLSRSETSRVKYQGNHYVKLKRGAWYVISNFVIKLLGTEEHPQGRMRHIRLVSDECPGWTGLVDDHTLVSRYKFKRLLVSRGNFVFYGSSDDLQRIWQMMLQQELRVSTLT